MEPIIILIFANSLCFMNAFAANIDHDLFHKQAHFYELGIQIQHMHEKLYAKCPHVFQTPDSATMGIIGRRRSFDISASSLDLKIELAEETLEKLIMKLGNCTSQATVPPTSVKSTTSSVPKTTTPRHQYAFQVLQMKNVTSNGYGFLLLQVRVPKDGLSKNSNWCYDYQYLCQDLGRRPTGCSSHYDYNPLYDDCREMYNSDMNIRNTLLCNPSHRIAYLVNKTFPNLTPPATGQNSFGFFVCKYCSKTIRGSSNALSNMEDFWYHNATIFYTACR